MKKYFSRSLISLAAQTLFWSTMSLLGQGVPLFSNLGKTPVGHAGIASDSWVAQSFITGTNPHGYVLNSVQMLMSPASGSPANFSLAVYSVSTSTPSDPFRHPGSLLHSLVGQDPLSGGTLTFSATDFTLEPNRFYYLVATALTPLASGTFQWSAAAFQTVSSGGWSTLEFDTSADGSTWSSARNQTFQFAINGTVIPEPSSLVLLCCGGLLLAARRCRVRPSLRVFY